MDLAVNPARPDSALTLAVRDLTLKYSSLWNETPEEMPAFSRRFTPAEQEEKHEELERLSPPEVPSRNAYRELPRQERAALRMRARAAVLRLLAPGQKGLRGFFDECERVTDGFVRMAEAFDPTLRDCDVHQALRNQWVFNSIQSILGLPVTLTPSSFAYSLLYPYTDNLLDGALPAGAESKRFLLWLSRRLEGDHPPIPHPAATSISWLLRLIEEEYPRTAFPLVHESLRAIHCAQEKSLRLHQTPDRADDCALTPVTIEKGGTSVLVDGFLASGCPDNRAVDALFAYGVLLQLIDDLQDVRDDAAAGHSTPFTRAAASRPLDQITNRLFHFTSTVTRTLGTLGGPVEHPIPGLIAQSCLLQIQLAVALHAALFTPPYLASVEEATPLSFAVLRQFRDRASGEITR